jgi:hypothetical protein
LHTLVEQLNLIAGLLSIEKEINFAKANSPFSNDGWLMGFAVDQFKPPSSVNSK